MNHSAQYRTTLPHQIHHTQCPPLQTFTTTRFPTLDNLNAVMIPTINHEDTGQYHSHIAPFMTEHRSNEQQQHLKDNPQQQQQQLNTNSEQRNDSNCPTTSGQTAADFGQNICSHNIKNCLQCYNKTSRQQQGQQTSQSNNRNKIMVDAATMTDCDEMDLTSNWQNVSVPANTKVAEYLTSLRQFLKMDRRFVCGVCGIGHARREQLERHQLTHSQERKHVCPACQKRFKRNEHLARHVITHSGLKPHSCLECGKAFYRKDHLRKHLLAHQTKRIRHAAGITTPGATGGISGGGIGLPSVGDATLVVANIIGDGGGTSGAEDVTGINNVNKSLTLSLP